MKKFLWNSVCAGGLWCIFNTIFLCLCLVTHEEYSEKLFWYGAFAEVDMQMMIKYICIFAIPAILAAFSSFFFGYKVLKTLESPVLNLFSVFPLHFLMTGVVYLTSLSMYTTVGLINWPMTFLKTVLEMYAVRHGTYYDFDAPMRSFIDCNYYDFGINFLLTWIPYFLMYFGLCLKQKRRPCETV